MVNNKHDHIETLSHEFSHTFFDLKLVQQEAVARYTSNPPQDPHYPPAGSFDPNGRATPDICALGEGYQVVANGAVEQVGGTSASTPAFAGMLALINEAREQAGKPAMGFLNAFLYKNADCFTDVTLGTNAIGRGTGPVKVRYRRSFCWHIYHCVW